MILLIPLFAYCILVLGLIFLLNWILKSNGKEIQLRKKVRKRVITSLLILIPIIGFFYLSYLFGIALDNHNDVKKGTFLWYATMDNETISEFPLIEPIGNVTYNSIGRDSPSIGAGWEIEYESKKSSAELIPLLKKYLLQEGYELKEVNEPECSWKNYQKNDSMLLFAGVSKKGECLDLTIEIKANGNSDIEVMILY